MRRRATFTASILLSASLAFAQTPPPPEVTFSEDFQAHGTQANPAGWVDTSVGQPTPAAAGLYKTWPEPLDKQSANIVYGTRQASGKPEGNHPRIGTFSTLTTKAFDARGRFEYRGRLLRTDTDSRIGLTVLSSYPENDRYYLVGLWSQPAGGLTMQLFGFGAGTLTGTTDSNVSIAPDQWYRFLLQVDDANNETRIRARFWADGTTEPSTFSIDAVDAASARLTRGRIGVWSAVKGEAYVDDLSAKSPVDFTPPQISILEDGKPLADGAIFKRDATPEIRVTDDLSSVSFTATLDGQPFTSLTPVTTERWHTLVVRATDGAGNPAEATVKFLVDKTPPAVNVLERGAPFVPSTYFNRDVVFTANVVDASNTTVAATIDGAAYAAGTAYGVEGAHNLSLTATDEAGWTTTVGPLPFVVDKTAPAIVFSSHQNGAVLTAAQVTVSGASDDAVSVVIGSAPATIDAAAKTFAGSVALLEGDNTIVARGTDRAGNTGEARLTLVLDTRAPELTITTPAADACVDAAAIAVSGSVTEARLESVKVNGVAATISGSTWSASIPATEGKLLITVDARDTSGHTASRTRSIIVDRTAPVIEVTSGGAPFTATRGNRPLSLFIRVTDSDPNVTVTATLDGAAYASGSSIESEGAHKLVVKASDCAGHTAERSFDFAIDLTAPTIRDFQPASGATVGTMPNAIRARTDSDVATVMVEGTSLSATPAGDGSFTIEGVPFAEGTNRFTLVATDRAGNSGSAPYSVIVRTAAPAVEIRESGVPIVEGALYNRAVTPMLRAVPDAAISATLNGAPYTSGTTVTADGSYRLAATATDDLGHRGSAEATFSIDRTAPVVQIAAPADGASVRSDRVEVRGSVGDAVAATINGAPLAIGSGGSFAIELPLDYGVNPISVAARDAAGNSGRADVSVTRDDAGAGILLTYPPDHSITNRSATDVVGRLLTAGRGTTVTIGKQSVAVDPTGGFRVTGYALAEGENTITATATAANGVQTSATTHVTADFTPPSLTILESNAALTDGARFGSRAVLSLDSSDSGGGPVTTELTVDGTVAAPLPATITAVGGHAVVAVSRDRAGNQARAERMFFIGAATGSADCRLEAFDPASNAVVLANSTTLIGRSGGALGVKVNGVPALVADGSFSATVELPNEGPNNVTITCTDANGAPTGTPVTLVLQRVTGDPSIAITSPAEGFVSTQETIAVSGTVGAGVVSADVNGVAATISGSTFTIPAVRLADGLNIIVARGRNAAGRTATASRRGTYESDLPAIAISTPTSNASTGANRIVVSGTYSNVDPASLVVTNLSGNQTAPARFARFSDTTGSFTADVPLVTGEQTLRVTGRDRANRQATASVAVRVVTGAPSITIDTPENQSYLGSAANFTVSGTFQAAAGSTVDVNGVPATISGTSYTASVKFGATGGIATPVVARVTQPDGATGVAMVMVTQLADAPKVVESFPAPNAVEVDAGALLLVLFSQPMERDSVTAAFRLEDTNGAPVSGTFYLDKDVLTFAPSTLLAKGGRYTIRVATAARNLGGTALAAAYASSFTVASSAPSTPPTLDPLASAVCGQSLTVTGTAAPGARVRLESGALVLTASADANGRFTFTYPMSGQSGFTLVRVRVVGSDGSLSPAAELTVRADCSGPQVLNASYDRGANRLTISFSEAVDASTTAGAIALVLTDGSNVASSASTAQNVVTVTPAADLTQKTFTLTVSTQIEDTTGNRLVAPYTQEFALSGGTPETGNGSGFISGEVYDATTGRPLPNATIAVDVASPAPVTTTTDARGRYLARLPEGAHTISAGHAGYTTVWREIIVPAGAGVIPIDIRLTRRGDAVTSTGAALALAHGGDTAVTKRVELTAPAGALVAGAKISVTSIGAQALTGLLPLGWSPIASAEVHVEGAPALNAATLTFQTPAGAVASAAQNLTAVRYDSARDEWRVLAAAVNVAADGRVAFPIPAPAAYALVYSDKAPGLTPPPLPVAGDVLQGVPAAPADAPQLVGRDFALDPPIVVPTGRTVATLRIEGAGAAKFPSGTAVQAYIDEELRLADGSRLLDPPFATDLLLYRNLSGDLGIADFHLAPSAKAAQVILDVGFDHIRILPYPGRLDRGTLIGPEGGRVPADDKVAVDIPTGSVPEPLRATATSLSATDLGAIGAVAGFRVVGGFQLSLQRATQPAPQDLDNDGKPDAIPPVELFVPATVTFSVESARLPAPSAQVILAELLEQTPYGRMLRLAVPMTPVDPSQSGTPAVRFTTKSIDRSLLPVDGVVREARYVLLAAEAPIAFATGTLRMRDTTGRLLADARVTAAPLGVHELTRANGIYNVAVPARPAAPFSLVPRHTSTGDGAAYTHAAQVDADSVVRVDLTLVPQPPLLGSVVVFKGDPPAQGTLTPGATTRDVALTTNIRASFTPSIDPASIVADSITVTNAITGKVVSGRATADGNVGVLWTLTAGERLEPNSAYRVGISSSIRGANGATLAAAATYSFSTVTQLRNAEIRRERIRITIPDAQGHSRIVGTAGALPAGWQAVAVRRIRDFFVRYQATAAADGSFSFVVGDDDPRDRVTMADLIDLQVINTNGALMGIYALTPFVTEDGRGFVAPAEMPVRFTSPEGITVDVPAGAFDVPTIVTVQPAQKADFLDIPRIEEENEYATSINIEFDGYSKKPLDVEVPVPAGFDTAGKDFILAWKGDSVRGPRLAAVDILRVHDGKFTSIPDEAQQLRDVNVMDLRTGTNRTLVGKDFRNYMIRLIRGGRYSVLDIRQPVGGSVGWAVMEGLQAGYDLMWDLFWSYYDPYVHVFERPARVIPVITGKPFTVYGIDRGTGLQAFSRAYDPIPHGEPGTVVSIPSPQQNQSGPYPVFGGPFRVEVLDVDVENVDIRSVRNFTVRVQGGSIQVQPSGDPLGSNVHVQLLNVQRGTMTSGTARSTLSLGAKIGDRVILLIEQEDADASNPISIVFNEPLYLGPDLNNQNAIDQFLHNHLKLEQAVEPPAGTPPLFTDITPHARFVTDSGDRRINVELPGALQRNAVYRLTLKGSLTDVTTTGPGLKLGQGTEDRGGTLTPVGGGFDLPLLFHTRKPAGAIGSFSTAAEGVLRGMDMYGNVLFAASLEGGLTAFDLSNPAALNGSAPKLSPTIGPPNTIFRTQAVTVDRHGRVFTTADLNIVGCLRTYRVEDFVAGTASVTSAKTSAIINWKLGYSSMIGLPSNTILSDRPESIPFRLKTINQDDTQEFASRLEFIAGTGAAETGSYPLDDLKSYTVNVQFNNAPYKYQRITIENDSLDMRWSADVVEGGSASIANVLARSTDKLRIVRNKRTYAVVAHLGYGVGVYDVNAMESNRHPSITAATKMREQHFLGNGIVGPECRLDPPIWAIGENYINTDVEVRGDTSGDLYVFANHPSKGVLDYKVHLEGSSEGPRSNDSTCDQRGPTGLIFRSYPLGHEGPRIQALRSAIVGAGGAGWMHTMNMSQVHWSVTPEQNVRGLRGTMPGEAARRDYLLVASMEFGVIVVEITSDPAMLTPFPLTDEHIADVIWIPGGAIAVRVMQDSNVAAVTDRNGRVLLVDLSRIDERWDERGNAIAGLFPTAKKAIAGRASAANELGADDPRIIYKSEPGITSGALAPVFDASTGILYGAHMTGRKVTAVSAIDPTVRMKVNLGGMKDVGGIVPLGVAPDATVQGKIDALPPCSPGVMNCRQNASLGVFQLEVGLPGNILNALSASSNELWVAVESERIAGAVTEQTPDGFPRSHLRRRRRDGSAERSDRVAGNFRLRRLVPEQLAGALKHQRGFNRFVSPWIVAIADPRASEKYDWNGATPQQKAEAGCFACERPEFLRNKTEADGIYELWTNGRYLTVRPELAGGDRPIFDGTEYEYLGERKRMNNLFTTIQAADTVRSPEVLVAAQMPPLAAGMIQDTLFLHSGEVQTSAVDLNSGGRAGFDVSFNRTYRSRTVGGTVLGQGWDSMILRRLRALPNGDVEYRDGAEVWRFKPRNDGSYESPKGLYLRLVRSQRGWKLIDQKWRITDFDDLGRILIEFDEFYTPGEEGSGNVVRYVYDEHGRLSAIVDPVARTSRLSYWSESEGGSQGAYPGLIKEISDWRNRRLNYHYDPTAGTLLKVELPDVTNTSGGRPTLRYTYTPASGYTDIVDLRANLRSITEPHEGATGGGARVTIDYSVEAGLQRDRAKSQQWATGENISFTYNSATDVQTKDALGQVRKYTLSQQPKDYMSDRAHVRKVVELDVPMAATAFGELPSTPLPVGMPATPGKSRTFTFEHNAEGELTSAVAEGVRNMAFDYQSVQPEGPGYVVKTATASGVGGSIQERYEYQSGENSGTYIQSVTRGNIPIITSDAHRKRLNPTATANDVFANKDCGPDGLTRKITTSGGTQARRGDVTTHSASGSSWTFTHAGADAPLHQRGLLTQIDRGEGVTTDISYPSPEKKVVTNERGIVTTLDLDSWQRATRMSVAGPGSTLDESRKYDANGQVTEVARKQGDTTVTWKYKYDPLGRIVERTVDNVAGPGIEKTTFAYNMAAKSITVTHPGGAVTTKRIDALGRTASVVTQTGSSPLQMFYAYDLDDNVVYQTDLLTASAMAFDSHNRMVGRVYPDGTKALAKYDDWGNPTHLDLVDRAGGKIGELNFQFTAAGELQSAMNAVDSSQVRNIYFSWDAAMRPTGMSVSGRAAEQTYDSAGRLLSSAHGEGNQGTVSVPYDETTVTGHDGTLPQTMSRKEKGGSAYEMAVQYNTSADVVVEQFGDLQWARHVDEAGNVTSLTMPNRMARTYDYDSRGKLVEEQLPGGGSLSYGYNASGAQSSFTDPTSEETTTTTDLIGRPVKISFKDGTSQTITWQGRRVKSITSREGRTQTFVYNDRDEVTQITSGDGGTLEEITYDAAGRITLWKNGDSSIEFLDFNYDGNPRRTVQSRYRGGTLVDRYEQTHTWNEHGDRVGFTMPSYGNFRGAGPWTAAVRQSFDATGNVTSIQRTMFGGGDSSSTLLTATYRNMMRPERRTVTTIGGAAVVRDYQYDAGNGLLSQLAVSVNGAIVAGSRVEYDGLQKSRAQLLAVSGGARSSQWSYDARSRVQNTILGRDADSTPQTEMLTASDFRLFLQRPAPTPADPPSLQFTESAAGHKIERVRRGEQVDDFTFVGGERREDGRYTYGYDAKGRLSLVTEKSSGGRMSVRRIRYAYDGNDRLVGRTAEYAQLSHSGATPRDTEWKLEDRPAVIAADALPADTTFVWDPVDDRLVAVFRAGASEQPLVDPHGGLIRQIIHGGLQYDDPIEVAAVSGGGVTHLYPIYDEAGAGSLQTILNSSGQLVSRSIGGGPYGEDETILVGGAVDRTGIDARTDDQGRVTGVDIRMRTTEQIDESTLAAGVRLAAVDAAGAVARTSSVAAKLAGTSTVLWSLTKEEWEALIDERPVTVEGKEITPAALSIAVTAALRSKSWSASAPILPAPAWAVAAKPVFTSAALPVEVREPLAAVRTVVASGGQRDLYEIPSLLALGTSRPSAASADPQRLIVASGFHAHPFQEPLTSQNYVRARWYDTQHGAWLTPDPMGYVDSPNLYAYAGGDPVNGRDPSGQYEADFHFGLTMYLALQAGFSRSQARFVADGTVRPDLETDERSPIPSGKKAVWGDEAARRRLNDWHFPKAEVETGVVVPCSVYAREKIDRALEHGQLNDFAEGLHPFQDSWSHRGDPSLGGYAGHSKQRGGGSSHDTDMTYKYPDVAMVAAEATYTYLMAYALKYPSQASGSDTAMPAPPRSWSAFSEDVRTFMILQTKTEKRDWLKARGVEMPDKLWEDVSLWEGSFSVGETASKAYHAVEAKVGADYLGPAINSGANTYNRKVKPWVKRQVDKVWPW